MTNGWSWDEPLWSGPEVYEATIDGAPPFDTIDPVLRVEVFNGLHAYSLPPGEYVIRIKIMGPKEGADHD